MKSLTWLQRLPGLPLYPVLAAAYPVIYLYAQNVQEAIAPAEIFVPLAICVLAALTVMGIVGALTRAWAAAALASTLLVVLFFTYGMAWDWLGTMLLGQWVLLGAPGSSSPSSACRSSGASRSRLIASRCRSTSSPGWRCSSTS